MLKILVTGSNGQLGSELKAMAPEYPEFSFDFTDVPELDICDRFALESYFSTHRPDALFNLAAYTAVDKAESEPVLADQVNHLAVKNLGILCSRYNCFPVHISTDYVFEGNSKNPYKEEDLANPSSVYGKTKLAGEHVMKSVSGRGLIIRTSWLYSSFGHNFVKTIIRKGKETGSLRVVSDQFGSPTYANDLARAILSILQQDIKSASVFAVYHYANEGSCSWYELAKAILDLTKIPCELHPILTKDYPLPASRPFYSVLDTSRIKEQFHLKIPFWKDSLNQCIERIVLD